MEPETAVKSIQKLLSVPLKHIFHFSPGLHNNEKSANPSIYDRIPTFLVVRLYPATPFSLLFPPLIGALLRLGQSQV